MKKINGKIKEHIYSKGNLIFKNKNKEDGTFSCKEEMLLQIMGKEDTHLGMFLIETFGLKEEPDILQSNNIKYIINEISSREVKKEILNKLFILQNYNPYIDKFPIECFSKNLQTLIKKKQKFILENVDFLEFSNINNIKVVCKYDKNDNSINYLLKQNDLVILYNSYKFIIISKNIDLSNIYKYFEYVEPNKWILESKKHRIYLKENKKTQFYIPAIYKELLTLL